MSVESEVFSAIDRIEAGDWDRMLHRLHGAVVTRQKTEDYRRTLIAKGRSDDDF